MRFAVTAIVAVVLGAGTWFLMTNSHVDIFPCEVTTTNEETHQTKTESKTCSLIDFKDSHQIGSERSKLTGAGYAVEAAVCGVVSLIIGLIVGSRVGRKKNAA